MKIKQLLSLVFNGGSEDGTYVCSNASKETAAAIQKFCKEHGIVCDLKGEPHCTIIYSRVALSLETLASIDTERKHSATFKDWAVLSTGSGKACLVMKLNAPSLVTLHMYLMAANPQATYDYAEYIPHVTVSYRIPSDFDVSSLPKFTEEFIFDTIKIEDLQT